MPDSISDPWDVFPRALLQAEAAIVRDRPGGPPDRLAGVRIDDAEVDRLIDDAGFGSGSLEAVSDERTRFLASLDEAGPLAAIRANVQISADDAEAFAVLLAVEADPSLQRLVAWLQDDLTRPAVTLHLLRRLFPHPHRGPLAVAPDAPLVRSGLVEVSDDGPWASRSVAVAASVLWAVDGDVGLDPLIPHGAFEIEVDEDHAGGESRVLVVGDDRIRRTKAAALAALGTRFLVVDAPDGLPAWTAVVREATLSGRGVIVHATSLSADARRVIDRAGHLVWALASRRELPLTDLPEQQWVEVTADPGTLTDDEWSSYFGDQDVDGHVLTADQARLVQTVYLPGDLPRAVRRLSAGPLDELATHIRPTRSWDELVLPDDRVTQLGEFLDRYRLQTKVHGEWGLPSVSERGLIGLFAGPSGTGKTMAAELIAGSLGVDLYTIDLSSVVSKYIGETEKNLEAIFTAASAGNLVLLFDEADALFGKRTDVSDAKDRYANVEVSYLLQRLERYEGVVVLTTNLAKNIDTAFRRRIHAIVEFPMPQVPERQRLWDSMLAPLPIGDIDTPFLAKQFDLAGGSIRNAVHTAAFLAAAEGDRVEMVHIVRGLGREMQKLGRLRSAIDFGPYHALLE